MQECSWTTLSDYKRVSGQLVNKKKSCVILAPNAQLDSIARVERITGMEHIELLIKYLGCPLYVGRKKNSIFSEMINKVLNEILGWHAKLLATGGRAVLIKHVLLVLSVYLLAVIHPPKGVLNQIEKMMARFSWSATLEKKKCH